MEQRKETRREEERDFIADDYDMLSVNFYQGRSAHMHAEICREIYGPLCEEGRSKDLMSNE